MRKITKIIVHCSDSDVEAHDNLETIRKWHVDERGWDDVGYHYVITKDGSVKQGRDIGKAGAHTFGHNDDSIGICLTGKEDFTPSQFFSLAWTIRDIFDMYPDIQKVLPHNFYTQGKTCPNFNLSIFDYSRKLRVGQDGIIV